MQEASLRDQLGWSLLIVISSGIPRAEVGSVTMEGMYLFSGFQSRVGFAWNPGGEV